MAEPTRRKLFMRASAAIHECRLILGPSALYWGAVTDPIERDGSGLSKPPCHKPTRASSSITDHDKSM